MKMLSSVRIAARPSRSIRKAELVRPSAISQSVCAAKKFHSSIWIILRDYGSGFNGWQGESDMSFFDKLFGRKSSADSAKERLQLVLIHDRTDLTPAELDSLRGDLISTISRHLSIDPDTVKIDVEHDGRSQRLVADIPLKAV